MKIVYITLLFIYSSIAINGIGNNHNIKDHAQSTIDSNFNNAITYLSEKWQLNNLQPIAYSALFNNYIAKAYSSVYEQEVVLKISQSDDELYGLQYLQGQGIVKLLDHDDHYFALLLEYIPCQKSLADCIDTYDDDWIIDAFINLFQKIHEELRTITPDHIRSIHDNFLILHTHIYNKIPQQFIKKAQQIDNLLMILSKQQYLLHGDLHFRNILQYKDNFIAIDPWITIGPLEYEAASFLTSPTDFLLQQNSIQAILQNRLNRLSDLLYLDKQHLKNYAFLRLIFLACLCEIKNKNDDWIDQFIQVATIVDQLEI